MTANFPFFSLKRDVSEHAEEQSSSLLSLAFLLLLFSFLLFSSSLFLFFSFFVFVLFSPLKLLRASLVQLLSILAANDTTVLVDGFDSEDLPLALERLAPDSRLFGDAPKRVLDTLTQTNSTMNLHRSGVPPSHFETFLGLKKTFRLLSINHDRKGRAFASTMEGHKLPFFATQ